MIKHPLPTPIPLTNATEPARTALDTLRRAGGTLPNYTLSTVCPSCGEGTFRLACKVRCARCGFMWDCSEL